MRHPPQPPPQPTNNALLGYRWMDGRQAGFLALRSHAKKGVCVCGGLPINGVPINRIDRINSLTRNPDTSK